MIVVEVLTGNELCVIHYSRSTKRGIGQKTVIIKQIIDINPDCQDVYRINYDSDKSYSGQDALQRALMRVGESDYNLLFNNCESFCTWVKVSKNRSQQSERGMAVATAGAAVVGAVTTVAALSFAVFRVFQSSNKSSN